MAQPSSSRKYVVFVSHAGEDKGTIAKPLRQMLSDQQISAFVDELDLGPGSEAIPEMTTAMRTADIAVIVLSPEFVAKEWPMKELLFFLGRRKKAQAKGESVPVILPAFYRLSVPDLYNEPNFEHKTADGRNLYEVTRFDERKNNGEPEADVENIRRALRALHGITGVENKGRASNKGSSLPSRQLLLEEICEKISMAIEVHKIPIAPTEEAPNTSDSTGPFRRHFHTEVLRNVVLDFKSVHANGEPLTQEGRIKRRILNRDKEAEQVFAILGMGGVGKSTILKAFANDEKLREIFCDGIHFISLGKDASIRTLAKELLRTFRNSGATRAASELETTRTSRNPEGAIRDAIREALPWFRVRSCLFLIDDVWTKGLDAELFSHVFKLAGQKGTVVFTTREHEIASVASNQESIFRLAPRETKGVVSRKMLFCHAGDTKADAGDDYSTSSIKEILSICGGLPVSLAAAGKGVKMMAIDMATEEGDPWTEYVKILRTSREQLLRENVGQYGNLYVTFRASISLLEGRESEKLGFRTRARFAKMHRRLFVLQKQDKAPKSMLRHLWELKNESEARAVGKQFVEVGLAESEFRKVGSNLVWYLSIHDSIHDFALSESKRHGDTVDAHLVLLNGYSGHRYTRARRFLWWFVPESAPWRKWIKENGDEYIGGNIDHHLGGAEQFADRDALENYDDDAWYESMGMPTTRKLRETCTDFCEGVISLPFPFALIFITIAYLIFFGIIALEESKRHMRALSLIIVLLAIVIMIIR